MAVRAFMKDLERLSGWLETTWTCSRLTAEVADTPEIWSPTQVGGLPAESRHMAGDLGISGAFRRERRALIVPFPSVARNRETKQRRNPYHGRDSNYATTALGGHWRLAGRVT